MLNIDQAKPTKKQVLKHLETFENYCLGQEHYTPSNFRKINEELSVSTVLWLGKRKYYKDSFGKRIVWRGLDERDYDLGYTHNAKVMRDYPGFHRKSIKALGENEIQEKQIIPIPNQKKTTYMVTLTDGTSGIGHDYRVALRNAVLKRHLKAEFNRVSLTNIWNKIWYNA